MDLSDLSVISVEDDLSNESSNNLNTKSESDNEDIDLSCSINENNSEDNAPNRENIKTGHSVEITKVSKIKVQIDNTEIQEDSSPIGSFDDDFVCHIYLLDGDKTLKSSQSMLSIVSTTNATCGSSSPELFSSEDEQSDDNGETRDAYESQDDTGSEVYKWLPKASMSIQPISSSLFDAKLTNRSQKLDCIFTAADDTDESFYTKNSSIKNTSAPSLLEKVSSSSTRNEEDCFASGVLYDHDSNRQDFLQTKDVSVRRKIKTKPSTGGFYGHDSNLQDYHHTKDVSVRRKIKTKASTGGFYGHDGNHQDYHHTTYVSVRRKTKTTPSTGGFYGHDSNRQDYHHTKDISVRRKTKTKSFTAGFYDHDYNHQDYHRTEDASVRRKVKTGSSTSSETYSLPSTSIAPSVSNSLTRIGSSLLRVAKPMEQTMDHREDSQIYKTFGRSHDVKYYTPKHWIGEVSTFCHQIAHDTDKRLDTERLLKEVQHFFQVHRVEADTNLSWDKNKQMILTSRYFSDDFTRQYGLMTYEELIEERLKELDRQSQDLTRKLSVLQLCGTLTEFNISEQEYIDSFHHRLYNRGIGIDGIFESDDLERFEHVNEQLRCIKADVGFDVMLELYQNLTKEGATFNSLLYKPKDFSAPEERFQYREYFENSSQLPHQFLEQGRSTNYMLFDRTVLQNRLNDTEGPSSEGNMLVNKYAMESSESKSNVLKSSIKD